MFPQVYLLVDSWDTLNKTKQYMASMDEDSWKRLIFIALQGALARKQILLCMLERFFLNFGGTNHLKIATALWEMKFFLSRSA